MSFTINVETCRLAKFYNATKVLDFLMRFQVILSFCLNGFFVVLEWKLDPLMDCDGRIIPKVSASISEIKKPIKLSRFSF